MLTSADRLAMLDVLYGVRVHLTPDRGHLDVRGPRGAVQAAAPMLSRNRATFLAYLLAVEVNPSCDRRKPE